MKEDDIITETDEEREFAELRAYPYYVSGGIALGISHLRVKKGAPAGTGTSVMNRVLRLADEHQVPVTLSASRFDPSPGSPWKRTTSTTRLKKFYRRLGFETKTKKGRYDFNGSLVRYPTPKA